MYHAKQIFFNKVAVAAVAVNSTVVDLGAPMNVSRGKAMPIEVKVIEEAFASAEPAAKLKLSLIESASEDMSNPNEIWNSGDIPVAKLVPGYSFPIKYAVDGSLRYQRIVATPSHEMTAGKLFAAYSMGHQEN